MDVAPNSGDMFDERGAVGDTEAAQSRSEEFHELADDAVCSEHLSQRQDEVGGRRADRERAARPHAEDDRLRQKHRLAEHRRFGFDAADSPSEHAEAIDHRCVRVGPDQRIGKDPSVARQDHLPQMFEVDLMADSHARRHDAKALEGLLRPIEQRVAFAVAAVFPLEVGGVGVGAAEPIDLDRVIDDEIDRNERIDAPGIPT